MPTNLHTSRISLFFMLFVLLFSYTVIAQDAKKVPKGNKHALNEIESQYHPNAIGISKHGLIQGHTAMKSFLTDFHNQEGAFVEFQSRYKVPVYQKLEYEIGVSQTSKGGQFAHIIIWSNEGGANQRIAEVVYEKKAKLEVPAELAKARKKWVELCSKKNAKKLVTELYTEDAIYYNRGRVLRGHDPLSQEYSYMNNPSYSLNLHPKHIEMVSEDIIYEIGMCSGSYNLPYILVWKKEADGNWRVYMDSNY